MSKMQIMEELAFLIEVRGQTTGVSYHDNITICCKSFESDKAKAELTLKAEVSITMDKLNHKEKGGYFESMFYDTKVPQAINRAVINKFGEIINDRIKELRLKVRGIMGIPGEKGKEIEQDYNQEGGTESHEANN